MEELVESFSGVRGIYGRSLNEKLAAVYAKAYLHHIVSEAGKAPKLVIGTDTRPSGDSLKAAMISALKDYCSAIIDVDVATTPMIELAVRGYKADGGIIITASHNPAEYNGWKFLAKSGAVLSASEMKKVIENSKNKTLKIKKSAKCKISNMSLDLEQKYRKFILDIVGKSNAQKIKKSKLKLVIDPNGGAAWSIAGKVLNDLGVEAVFISEEPGKFHRKIEPTEQSLSFMVPIVKEENANFGVGFDCDADRAEFVLPFGEIFGKTLSGHYLIAILADYLLPKSKNIKSKVVVVNDATSQIVAHVAKKHKAKLYVVEVGETNVVSEMQRKKACIGGEGSAAGGIIPPSTCRDGILGMAMLLAIIANTKKTLVDLASEMPRYYTPQIKVKTKVANLKRLVKNYFKEYKITETGDETGGIKVWIDAGSWIWFRGSKTEPDIINIIADSMNQDKSDDMIILGKKALGIDSKVC